MKDKLAKLLIDLDQKNPEKSEQIAKLFVQSMKGNEYQLPSILKIVEQKAQEEKERNTLYITLFEEIEDIDAIKEAIGIDKSVPVDISIDKELKGGFVAQYNGKLYNGSISNQLQKIRQQILCQ
jgi:F0F1-type ATP synthase delta subunit